MLRTILGAPSNYADLNELNSVTHLCPFLVSSSDDGATWQYALPAPADAVAYDPEESSRDNDPLELAPLTPQSLGDGAAVFDCDAVPQFLFGAREAKPSRRLPGFWTWTFYARWLTNRASCAAPRPREVGPLPMGRQKRIHVAITPATQTAAEGLLFATDNLEFLSPDVAHSYPPRRQLTRFALVSKFELPVSPSDVALPRLGLLGGESRMVMLEPPSSSSVPSVPGYCADFPAHPAASCHAWAFLCSLEAKLADERWRVNRLPGPGCQVLPGLRAPAFSTRRAIDPAGIEEYSFPSIRAVRLPVRWLLIGSVSGPLP